MHCTEAQHLLDDYLDGLLDPAHSEQLHAHLEDCAGCRDELLQRRDLQARLRRLPIDGPRPGFAARAVHRARQKHQQRTRGFVTGFGTAAAAGLALWVAVAFWQPVEQHQAARLQTITLQVKQPRTISLAFNVPEQKRYEQVHFRLQLPPGVAVADRPGEREIAWQDRLEPGRNLLTLPLVAESAARGDLVAQIEVQGVKKIFRIPVRTLTREPPHARISVTTTPA